MAVLLTYDVSGKNTPVKDAMIAKGFMETWYFDNRVVTLPATTLWLNSDDATSVVHDLRNVVADINDPLPEKDHIRIERVVAVVFDIKRGWSAEYGDPYEK